MGQLTALLKSRRAPDVWLVLPPRMTMARPRSARMLVRGLIGLSSVRHRWTLLECMDGYIIGRSQDCHRFVFGYKVVCCKEFLVQEDFLLVLSDSNYEFTDNGAL